MAQSKGYTKSDSRPPASRSRFIAGLALMVGGLVVLAVCAPTAWAGEPQVGVTGLLWSGSALPRQAQSAVETVICGPIPSPAHWTVAGSPYLVSCPSEVGAGGLLTIDPGVVVKLKAGTHLTINGSVQAVGTHDHPILFTSAQPSPAPGDWERLVFAGSHESSLLQNVVVEYGGATGSSIYFESGALTIRDSVIRFSQQVGLQAHQMPTVTGTLFEHNGGAAAELLFFSGCGQPGEFGGNEGAWNGVNGVRLAGTFDADVTLGGNGGLSYYTREPALGVSEEHTLILGAGAVLKLDGTKLIIDGTLRAEGSDQAPVVVTSLKDDSYGGDTNGDGGASQPAPADWRGVLANSPSSGWTPLNYVYLPLVVRGVAGGQSMSPSPALTTGENMASPQSQLWLEHAIVRYGGYDQANVEVFGGRVWVLDSVIEHSAKKGLHIEDTSPEIRNSTISQNAGPGLWLYGDTVPIGPVLVDNQFVQNGTYAAYLIFNGGCHPTTEIRGNQGWGNGTVNGIYVEGYVHTPDGCRWQPNPQLPYVVWGVTVTGAGRLVLDPGTQVKFVNPDHQRGSGTLLVYGILEAAGTSEAPVAFTSFWDDEIGGDTDGSPAPAAAGDWIGILVQQNGRAVMDHTLVRYGGSDGTNVWAADGSLQLTNSEISYSAGRGLGILFTEWPLPVYVAHTTFTGNAGYAVEVNSDAAALVNVQFWDNHGSGNGINGILLDAMLGTLAFKPNPNLPYVIQSLVVTAGSTVTVEPGVVFKADRELSGGGSLLSVAGVLQISGSAEDRVVFTSLHDDSVGGDTDGNLGPPSPGDWIGITVTESGQASLDYATVRYGGAEGNNVYAWGTSFRMTNCELSYSADRGLQVLHSSPAASLFVQNNSFANNEGYPISLRSEGVTMGAFEFSGNSGSGNGTNGILMDGALGTVTFKANATLPYVVQSLVVPAGKTVIVEPGVVFKADKAGLAGGTLFAVDGALEVQGAAGNQVYFTSLYDDSVGGDTDGTAATPAPGDWMGLAVRPGGQAGLSYAVVRYAGSEDSSVFVDHASLALAGSTIAYGTGNGLQVVKGEVPTALVVQNNSFIANSGYAATLRTDADTLGAFEFSGNSGSGNGLNGIWLDGALQTIAIKPNPTLPYLFHALTVGAGQTVTVEAGAVFKADLDEPNHHALFAVDGALVTAGSAGNPVVFTSINENAAGGLSLDGSPLAAAAGDWLGINVRPNGQASLNFTSIRYAGADGSSLYARNALVQMTESEIVHGAGTGLQFLAQTQSALLTVGQSVFESNGGYAAVFRTTDPVLGNFEFDGNTGSGNLINGIMLDAVLDSLTLKANPSLPYIIQSITVPAGETVTVEPAVVFKASQELAGGGSLLVVNGSLQAVGTLADPVVLTSLYDDTVGGDTDGEAVPPSPGDWRGISVSSGAHAELGNCVATYAGFVTAALFNNGGELTISDCLVAFSLNHGIASMAGSSLSLTHSVVSQCGGSGVSNGGQALLTHNDFAQNAGYGVYSGPSIVAENNYWGSADGPGWDGNIYCNPPPPGQGAWVSCLNVDYQPFSSVPFH